MSAEWTEVARRGRWWPRQCQQPCGDGGCAEGPARTPQAPRTDPAGSWREQGRPKGGAAGGRAAEGSGLQVPDPDEVFTTISRAKMQLLQTKWKEAGGQSPLLGAWQVQNRRLDQLHRAAAQSLALRLGRTSDVIDGWHGTPEKNVRSVAQLGFDPSRRAGQAFGAGEYFAKDPNVSVRYACGGSFLFLCKLLLGAEGADHTWVDAMKYYVVKQHHGLVQAVPVYLVQFAPSAGELAGWLSAARPPPRAEEAGTLQDSQRGGQSACEARRDAGMSAEATRHLWLGWLAPQLASATDDAIYDDVCAFLHDLQVAEVVPERNGARVGAHVRLAEPLPRDGFVRLAERQYRGRCRISVDDAQPNNPRCAGKLCPRLSGPSGYCRGWNIVGHHAWQWGCSFDHPLESRPTHRAKYTLEDVSPKTAKYDEIQTALEQSAPFHNGCPRIVQVHRVANQALAHMYEQRRSFLTRKHGFCVEKELWHGTNCRAIPELLTHGLQPPSDTVPGEGCRKSGGQGLCTTLCGSSCRHCREPHAWGKCHMYGLGVYLADLAQKSHRYVREPERRAPASAPVAPAPRRGVGAPICSLIGRIWGFVVAETADAWRLDSGHTAKKANEGCKWAWAGAGRPAIRGTAGELWGEVVGAEPNFWRLASGRVAKKDKEGVQSTWEPEPVPQAGSQAAEAGADVYSMLLCRVCLGNPYLIESNLLGPSSMHDVCWCQDPSEQLEAVAEDWSLARGHDSFYVRGLSGTQRAGLGVYNSEYVVFQPFQILPLYKVDYVLR